MNFPGITSPLLLSLYVFPRWLGLALPPCVLFSTTFCAKLPLASTSSLLYPRLSYPPTSSLVSHVLLQTLLFFCCPIFIPSFHIPKTPRPTLLNVLTLRLHFLGIHINCWKEIIVSNIVLKTAYCPALYWMISFNYTVMWWQLCH